MKSLVLFIKKLFNKISSVHSSSDLTVNIMRKSLNSFKSSVLKRTYTRWSVFVCFMFGNYPSKKSRERRLNLQCSKMLDGKWIRYLLLILYSIKESLLIITTSLVNILALFSDPASKILTLIIRRAWCN